MTLTSTSPLAITSPHFYSAASVALDFQPVPLHSAPLPTHPTPPNSHVPHVLILLLLLLFWFVAVHVHQHWPREWNVGRMRQSDQLEPLLVISVRRRWIEQLSSHHHTQPATSAKLCKQPATAAATATTTAECLTLEHGLLYRFGRQYGGLRNDIATRTSPSPPPSPPAAAATATTGRWLRFQSEPLR